MAGEPSASPDWVQLLLGGGAAALLAGIAKLWRMANARLDRRELALEERRRALDAEEQTQVEELRSEVEKMRKWQQLVTLEMQNHRVSLHLLIAKIARDDPMAPELRQVKEILGGAFPTGIAEAVN